MKELNGIRYGYLHSGYRLLAEKVPGATLRYDAKYNRVFVVFDVSNTSIESVLKAEHFMDVFKGICGGIFSGYSVEFVLSESEASRAIA